MKWVQAIYMDGGLDRIAGRRLTKTADEQRRSSVELHLAPCEKQSLNDEDKFEIHE